MSVSSTDKTNLRTLEQSTGLNVPKGASWAEMVLQGNFREALPLIEEDLAEQTPSARAETPDLAASTAGSAETKTLSVESGTGVSNSGATAVESFANGLTGGADRETSCLTKLWWVRAQLATDGMPLAALTTPLGEILPELKDQPRLERLGASTFYLLADQLARKKQTRLATVFFDHALTLASPLAGVERRALRAYAASVYREEIARAAAKREPEPYIKKLNERARELEKEEPVERAPTASPKKPLETPLSPSLSAKTIRGVDFSQKSFRDDGDLAADATAREPERKKLSSGQASGFLFGALFVLFIIGAWEFGFRYRNEEELQIAENPSVPAQQAPIPVTTPSPSPPPPQSAATALPGAFPANPAMPVGAEIVQKLNNIDQNLDTLGERLKNVTFKGVEKAKTAEDVSKDPEVDQNALTAKEAQKLPRSAPPPGNDELSTIDGPKHEAPTPTADPRKIPLLDPKKMGTVTTNDLGPADNLRSVEPANPKDRDSIQPGLPNFGGPPDPKGKTLDGSPLRSYPVDRLPEPEVYKTIIETNVLAAPSLLAQTLVRLPVDTSVQVVSHVGQWLELRSLGGKRGFIYSQNAVPSSEPPKDEHPLDHLD